MFSFLSDSRYLLLLFCALCGVRSVYAQPAPVAPVVIDWQTLADTTLGKAIKDQEVPGATVVIVDRNQILYIAGFGVSHLNTQRPVTDTTLFQVGSIGKVLTAMAVLQQVERGRLDLSEDINTYLTDWQVEAPGKTSLTLHHLLTHSGGLNDRAIGYAVRQPEQVAPLGSHLITNFPPFFSEPGRYISYSNYGFGLAGYVVEAVTSTPFAAYVSTEVLAPMDIYASGYETSEREDVAVGYRRMSDSFEAAPSLYRPVTPAGSFIANAQDMGKFLRALLNDGAAVLSRESVRGMTEVQKNMHPALMGNAYGLEESRWGTIQGFGKGGSIPGFMAYMALLPEQELGIFVAVNGSSDAPIDQFVLAVMDQLSEDPGPAFLEPQPSDVSQFMGEYRNNRYDRTSIEKLLNFEVRPIYDTKDGNLTMWHDGKMNVYRSVRKSVGKPVGELIGTQLFQHIENPHRMLFFETDETGKTTHAFFNDRIAGGYVPVVWEKNGFWDSNQYINEYFGIVMLVGLGYLFLPLIALIVWLVQRRRAVHEPHGSILHWMNGVGFITSVLSLSYALFYFIPMLKRRSELIFGIPETLARWEILPICIMGGFALFAIFWVIAMRRSRKNWLNLAAGFFFLVSGILFGEFFLRWNLI